MPSRAHGRQDAKCGWVVRALRCGEVPCFLVFHGLMLLVSVPPALLSSLQVPGSAAGGFIRSLGLSPAEVSLRGEGANAP